MKKLEESLLRASNGMRQTMESFSRLIKHGHDMDVLADQAIISFESQIADLKKMIRSSQEESKKETLIGIS